MDLLSIGNFTAQLRKQKELTQEQFGEQIGVTNKTVSRWETGVYMPPADALMKMSELFGITINELLSGKRLSEQEYIVAAEKNLNQLVKSSKFGQKDKIEFFKKKWLKEHAAIMALIGICIIAVLAAGIIIRNSLLVAITPLLVLTAHGWRNNSMMAYVEKHVYDETEKNSSLGFVKKQKHI